MRKNIMAQWKEFNPQAEKSMRDDFQKQSSPDLQVIINYLENGKLSSACVSCGKDVFTGERITDTRQILTDGEYSWMNTLIYYVKTYNLKLPQEFEDKINRCY